MRSVQPAGKHAVEPGLWPGATPPNANATAKNPLVIDLDASPATPHSENEQARPTFKKGFGFHPLLALDDHGTSSSCTTPATLGCARPTRPLH